jgi:hypothetical protein
MGWVNEEISVFLASALDGVKWSASRPPLGTHPIGSWVGFGTGFDDVENILDPADSNSNPLLSSP